MRACLVFALPVCLVVSILTVAARACAPAWPRGEHVRIATESALIIWDEKTKTQHFIRRASFEARVPYFGFLVPTPSQPKLAEAPDELFQRLEDWTKPEKKTKIVYDDTPPFACAARTTRQNVGRVQELARQHVAGYDARVLKADDVQALRRWLEEHGYDARPQLMTWLEPYIKSGWIVTAFQIAKTDQRQEGLSTQAVRMSFQTDKPFFPYQEPADLRQGDTGPRMLRIFVLSGQRMQGKLDEPTMQWPGKAVWANPLAADQRQALAGQLDSRQAPVPEGAWLTVFDDSSSPRPGSADLFFFPSPDQSRLQREPIFEYRVVTMTEAGAFTCFLVLAGPAGLWVLVRWRKRRKAAAT